MLFRDGTAIRKLTIAFIRSMILPRGGVKTLVARPNLSGEVWEIYERLTGKPRPEIFQAEPKQFAPPRNDEPPL